MEGTASHEVSINMSRVMVNVDSHEYTIITCNVYALYTAAVPSAVYSHRQSQLSIVETKVVETIEIVISMPHPKDLYYPRSLYRVCSERR